MLPRNRAAWALCLLGACAAACKGDGPPSRGRTGGGTEEGAARAVRTAKATEVALGKSVVVSGTLAAHEQATLATKVAGRLNSLFVDLGTPVRRGQLIARVEPTDYQLRVQQAEAALAEARARLGLGEDGAADRVDPAQTPTVRQAQAVLDEARSSRERSTKLFEEGLISQAEHDAAQGAYRVAEGRYQDALQEIRSRQARPGSGGWTWPWPSSSSRTPGCTRPSAAWSSASGRASGSTSPRARPWWTW
jgi:multidrug efflux pump subunit AcrA (membrane-fusion protein)